MPVWRQSYKDVNFPRPRGQDVFIFYLCGCKRSVGTLVVDPANYDFHSATEMEERDVPEGGLWHRRGADPPGRHSHQDLVRARCLRMGFLKCHNAKASEFDSSHFEI